MKLVYFAWVRERIGRAEEELAPPPEVTTVTDLIAWLRGRGEEYAYAFEDPGVVRAAIDRTHAKPDAAIAGAGEIAFFPPMTGG
ncbi:molybdopterin synthase sulfur carrier subunit [Methylobacterium brachiatum]|jgi:molybdopterin synthase sulfur carrier subunit|uniref:Molybdopterin synthase sulfur carrier subunit n=1 Tax=Methylobacterium brachiatum TaxID=269660 RepID=A0AAJ1TTL4_9HYPH|nr:molybdopterin converting factor subunit 1 [Methylobacterium brachiatum]MCB4801959.1 molybdopterin converting factor subunit 1 [Methylobacterium brachiatum]MDQ0542298.1 molybdopterin synthase sulfur carrier subunit [Methylobacterium brachiatum]